MARSLWLRSPRLAVEVRPGKGADITAITDVASGVNVLFQTPWGHRDLSAAPVVGDSQVDWLARYGGGWQQLVPNAGSERVVDGVRRGYHGEAAIVGWDVCSASETTASLAVQLITAPLRLTRELSVDGPVLTVRDTIQNTSTEPVPAMWVQHPAFGAPFIDEHCTFRSGARTLITDAVSPGSVLVPDTVCSPDSAPTVDGATLDLSSVPGAGSGRSVFGCLADFDDGWFQIDSPTAGFGIRFEWDADVLPYAWLWQECHASSGFPWYRRAYVVAAEPANVIPGEPSAQCGTRGAEPILAGGADWSTAVRVIRTGLNQPAT